MKSVAAFVVALFAGGAHAAPMYLKCQLEADATGTADVEDFARSAPMDVTLNEDGGSVTYSFPTAGRIYSVRGAFTVDKVRFNGFTIDRTNLAFQRESLGKIDHGRCALIELKRAF